MKRHYFALKPKRLSVRADTPERGAIRHDGSSSVVISKDPQEELPYIVVVIDEFADLMMVAGKEVSEYCVAQLHRRHGLLAFTLSWRLGTRRRM